MSRLWWVSALYTVALLVSLEFPRFSCSLGKFKVNTIESGPCLSQQSIDS